MAQAQCIGSLCFVHLSTSGSKFFGFAEFLAALALLVLAWTIADVRYRFRIETAPIPLRNITFVAVAAVGILTLLTDLWRTEGWLVPSGHLITAGEWQAVLGLSFLITFLLWAWYAFISPPKYSRHNCASYERALYRQMLKGSSTGLAVIADELSYSALSIIRHAPENPPRAGSQTDPNLRRTAPLHPVAGHAHNLLLLVSDPRFCRAIVEGSTGTALAFFEAVRASQKYGLAIGTFGRNVLTEALSYRDSFLYHEMDGYTSGYVGYAKPLTQSMFGDYELIRGADRILDLDWRFRKTLDSTQWEAYCKVLLAALESYLKASQPGHSPIFFRTFGNLADAVSDLYLLNDADTAWRSEPLERLSVIAGFVQDVLTLLDRFGVPPQDCVSRPDALGLNETSIYDCTSNAIFELIKHASSVHLSQSSNWAVQYITLWSPIFTLGSANGQASTLVKRKVVRLIFRKYIEMNTFPNFVGAHLLRICLNVLGFSDSKRHGDRTTRSLQVLTRRWLVNHFCWLRNYNPLLAAASLPFDYSYDGARCCLVYHRPAEGLRREAFVSVLQLRKACHGPDVFA